MEGEYLVDLTPKNRESFVTRIKIWLDSEDFLIRKIEYRDINENATIWEITEIDLNPDFSSSHFNYKAPSGAEVIDLR